MKWLWGSVVIAWLATLPIWIAAISGGSTRLFGPLYLLVLACALIGLVVVTGAIEVSGWVLVVPIALWFALGALATVQATYWWPPGPTNADMAGAVPVDAFAEPIFALCYTVVICVVAYRRAVAARKMATPQLDAPKLVAVP